MAQSSLKNNISTSYRRYFIWFIRYAGKHDNLLVNIISAPGIAMQIITTSEPDDSMIEVAIASLNAVLEEEPEENANS